MTWPQPSISYASYVKKDKVGVISQQQIIF